METLHYELPAIDKVEAAIIFTLMAGFFLFIVGFMVAVKRGERIGLVAVVVAIIILVHTTINHQNSLAEFEAAELTAIEQIAGVTDASIDDDSITATKDGAVVHGHIVRDSGVIHVYLNFES